jgi:hypothetical protein
MKRDIYDHPLEAKTTSAIDQCRLDQPGCLVVKQTMPPFGRDDLGQNHCGE